MKKSSMIAMTLAAALSLSLTACGGSAPATETAAPAETVAETVVETEAAETETPETEVPETEYDPMVECIDLSFDEGSVKYVGFEKADPNLTDDPNAMLFIFEYTNQQTKPAQFQSTFILRFFQNGAELNKSLSYSSAASEQYELRNAFFNEAMKGGTVRFAELVALEDGSPVTIMADSIYNPTDTSYQMMEVDISSSAPADEAAAEEASAEYTAEDIDAMLQGTWAYIQDGPVGGTFLYSNGECTIETGGQVLNGPYTIDMDAAQIDTKIQATDGTVTVHTPFRVTDGELSIYNNNNEELVKQ